MAFEERTRALAGAIESAHPEVQTESLSDESFAQTAMKRIARALKEWSVSTGK
jgi:hypothetical protein